MIKLSTSILSSTNRIDCIKNLNNTNTDYIHIDVMDGKFVPNKQFTTKEIIDLSNISEKKIDIHLMVENPMKYIKKIIKLKNIEYITFHIEINKNKHKIINYLKKKNIKCGLAINPDTNINNLLDYINEIDMINIMSVNPGYGGQQFIPNTIDKINEIKSLGSFTIEIDGGINNEIMKNIKSQIDIAVVGSYITNSNNYNKTINELKN